MVKQKFKVYVQSKPVEKSNIVLGTIIGFSNQLPKYHHRNLIGLLLVVKMAHFDSSNESFFVKVVIARCTNNMFM